MPKKMYKRQQLLLSALRVLRFVLAASGYNLTHWEGATVYTCKGARISWKANIHYTTASRRQKSESHASQQILTTQNVDTDNLMLPKFGKIAMWALFGRNFQRKCWLHKNWVHANMLHILGLQGMGLFLTAEMAWRRYANKGVKKAKTSIWRNFWRNYQLLGDTECIMRHAIYQELFYRTSFVPVSWTS